MRGGTLRESSCCSLGHLRLLDPGCKFVESAGEELDEVSTPNTGVDGSFGSPPCLYLTDHRSQLKRENPLNLSILIRGGKETNKDSSSNGE